MRDTGKLWMVAVACTLAIAGGKAHADEIGWFDSVDSDLGDTANGWVCMNEDPYNTPMYGSLDVYLGGPKETGFYYGNFPLQAGWGLEKDGVNQMGYCGTDAYVGFSLMGWFTDNESKEPTKVYVYWRNNMGYQTMLGGSPITVTSVGINIGSSGDQNTSTPPGPLAWRANSAHPYVK